MLKDGLFERFPCNAVYGMHNRPGLPVGKFIIAPGTAMAGGAFFDITITGKGAHGARPEQSMDPVLVACHLGTALQSIVSRNDRRAIRGGQHHPHRVGRRLQRHPADRDVMSGTVRTMSARR